MGRGNPGNAGGPYGESRWVYKVSFRLRRLGGGIVENLYGFLPKNDCLTGYRQKRLCDSIALTDDNALIDQIADQSPESGFALIGLGLGFGFG